MGSYTIDPLLHTGGVALVNPTGARAVVTGEGTWSGLTAGRQQLGDVLAGAGGPAQPTPTSYSYETTSLSATGVIQLIQRSDLASWPATIPQIHLFLVFARSLTSISFSQGTYQYAPNNNAVSWTSDGGGDCTVTATMNAPTSISDPSILVMISSDLAHMTPWQPALVGWRATSTYTPAPTIKAIKAKPAYRRSHFVG